LSAEKRRAKRENTRRDIEALEAIHKLLDGTEWGTHTLEEIADIIQETGREIRDCNYLENYEGQTDGIH
jgi:uncharacterized FlgJ-related protein